MSRTVIYKETKHANCPWCGRFMKKESEIDDPLEDEVVQWWSCKECGLFPEHLYFKSQIKSSLDSSKESVKE